jgi:hypothetical protein
MMVGIGRNLIVLIAGFGLASASAWATSHLFTEPQRQAVGAPGKPWIGASSAYMVGMAGRRPAVTRISARSMATADVPARLIGPIPGPGVPGVIAVRKGRRAGVWEMRVRGDRLLFKRRLSPRGSSPHMAVSASTVRGGVVAWLNGANGEEVLEVVRLRRGRRWTPIRRAALGPGDVRDLQVGVNNDGDYIAAYRRRDQMEAVTSKSILERRRLRLGDSSQGKGDPASVGVASDGSAVACWLETPISAPPRYPARLLGATIEGENVRELVVDEGSASMESPSCDRTSTRTAFSWSRDGRRHAAISDLGRSDLRLYVFPTESPMHGAFVGGAMVVTPGGEITNLWLEQSTSEAGFPSTRVLAASLAVGGDDWIEPIVLATPEAVVEEVNAAAGANGASTNLVASWAVGRRLFATSR